MNVPPQFRPGFRPQYRGGGTTGSNGAGRRPHGAPRPQVCINYFFRKLKSILKA